MNTTVRLLSIAVLLASLISATAMAAQPMVPSAEMPKYQLSNIRMESGFAGQTILAIDYRRVSEGQGSVRIAGKTPGGDLQIIGAGRMLDGNTGTIRLAKRFGGGSFGRNQQNNYEVYLLTSARWVGKSFGECMVSNAVRLGDPGQPTQARQWTSEEQAAYEKNKLAKVPPASLPDGFVAIGPTTPVAPGMPIKAGSYGDWVDAELIAEAPAGKVSLKFYNSQYVSTLSRDKWVAALPETLEKAKTNPSQFTPSVRILPGGNMPLPRDAEAIDLSLDLPKGTPLIKAWGGDWDLVYVLEDRGSSVRIRFADRPIVFAENCKRNELAIRKKTLAQLQDPAEVAKFAANAEKAEKEGIPGFGGAFPGVEAMNDGFGSGRDNLHIIDRDYEVELSIPQTAELVPEDLKLPEGTTVAYCRGRRWQAATVITDEEEKVVVRKSDRASGFAYRLPRSNLIIQKKTLRKMQRESGAKAADLKKTLRTWTDSTGQHKVEAYFVRIDGEKVVLKSDAGREIKLSLNRLSDEDRELLENLPTESENPFE